MFLKKSRGTITVSMNEGMVRNNTKWVLSIILSSLHYHIKITSIRYTFDGLLDCLYTQ